MLLSASTALLGLVEGNSCSSSKLKVNNPFWVVSRFPLKVYSKECPLFKYRIKIRVIIRKTLIVMTFASTPHKHNH